MQENKAPHVHGDRWVRHPEEFAVRVHPDDVKGFLSRRVTVEPGTVGVVEKAGQLTKHMDWGTHTLNEFFQLTRPTNIYLIMDADAIFRPIFGGLKDANGADVDVQIQVILGISDYDRFVRQFFEGHKRRVTMSMIEEYIVHEFYDVLRGLIHRNTLEDMYGNLEWRDDLENALREEVSRTFDRVGLHLVQLNFVSFAGEHFELIQKDRGEIFMGNQSAETLAARLAIRKRINELNAQGKLDEATLETNLKTELEELDAEFDIKKVLREKEVQETVNQALHDIDLQKKYRSIELRDLDTEYNRKMRIEEDELRRQLELSQARHQEQIASVGVDEYRHADTRRRMDLKYEADKRHTLGNVDLDLDERREGIRIRSRKDETEIRLTEIERMGRLEMEQDRQRYDYDYRSNVLDADVAKQRIRSDEEIAKANERVDAAAAKAKAEELDKFGQEKSGFISMINDTHKHNVSKITGQHQPPNVAVVGRGHISQNTGTNVNVGGDACPRCGCHNDHGTRYCGDCGNPLSS